MLGAVPNVKEAGDAGEDASADGPDFEVSGGVAGVPTQQEPADGDHLKNGGDLAGDSRADRDLTNDESDGDGADAQEQVATNDGAGKPQGKLAQAWAMIEAQKNDGGDEQELVGQGVENGAEFATLVVVAGDIAIDPVEDGGDAKGEHAQQTMEFVARLDVIENFDYEKGDEQNPEDGDFVRGGHRQRDSGRFGKNFHEFKDVWAGQRPSRKGC